jgi:hypothetical protein
MATLHGRNAGGRSRRTRRMFSEPGLASPPFDKISPENNSSEHRKPWQPEPLPSGGIGNPREHREFLGVKGLVQSPLFEDGFQPDALELEIVRHALGQAASKGEVRGVPCEPGAFRRHSTSADSWTSCRFTTFQSGAGGRVERKNYGRFVLRGSPVLRFRVPNASPSCGTKSGCVLLRLERLGAPLHDAGKADCTTAIQPFAGESDSDEKRERWRLGL